MSDLTPTTEQVRHAYRIAKPRDHEDGGFASWLLRVDAEFDRWLASVKADAWAEGAKWGALQVAGLPNTDTEYVQIKAGSNPYRRAIEGDTDE